MQPPFLRVGRGRKAGSVVSARGPRSIRLDGPAVRVGVPSRCLKPVRLLVRHFDFVGCEEFGRPGPESSADLEVQGGTIGLKRPVYQPRLWLQPGAAGAPVAFHLRRLRRSREDSVKGVVISYDGVYSSFRLWSGRHVMCRLPGNYSWKGFTWDRKHCWVLLCEGRVHWPHQLRRLADGALMSVLPPDWPAGRFPHVPVTYVVRNFGTCVSGCCYWKDGQAGHLPRARHAAWSPFGDRLVELADTLAFFERTVADNFSPRRLLPVPDAVRPFAYFSLTAAGELLIRGGCGRWLVWHESQPGTVRELLPAGSPLCSLVRLLAP